MAAVGWSWVILTLETILVAVLGYLEPVELEAMFNLGWLCLIIPAIGSGFGLWANSLIVAFQRRQIADFGVAGWNTYAHAHNIYSMAKHAPGAIQSVIKAFSKSKGGRQLLAIILLVMMALGGGVLITIAIVRWSDRNHAISAEAIRG